MHSQRERVWAFPLESRRTAKRRLNHLYRLVLLVFVFLQAKNLGFFFHTCSTLGPSPGVHTHPSAKMDLEVKASGRSKTLYGLELSPDFWHQGALVCLPYPLLKQGFFFFFSPLFIFAIIIPLRCLQEACTHSLMTIYPVSIVTFISESKQEAGCKFLNWSPPISSLRKFKEETGWL